jgi:hypothetical protein
MARKRKPEEIATMEFVKDALADGAHHIAEDREAIKAGILALVAEAIDQKLPTLVVGQALGIVFRLEALASDGDLRDGPSARLAPEAVEWREAVFNRDGYRCRDCGDASRLNAHHIIEWADDPAHRFDVDNGVTLCVECHAA